MTELSRPPILIVDDEPEVLASLRGMFRRDYQVFTARDGYQGLEILAKQVIHVLISDQRMPGMNGADFLAKVHQEHPDVVRLMITGYSDIDSVIAAINRGHVFRYITKPWDPLELESIVRQAFERYDLMAERRKLLLELEEANQLKTAFITVASHELNTPLTVVLGMLRLAVQRNSSPQVSQCLERALRAAERLQALLVNTFKLLQQRNFHRSLHRTTIRCDELLAEIRQDIEPYLLIRRHTLRESIEPADLAIHASRNHLRDVLENLVTNAIKFSPDGSVIDFAVRREDHGVIFEVTDRGVGIASADQPHVFEPLFSTWDTMHHSTGDYGYCKRGMGLGLAIVKRLVEMHGGEIDFDTTPDEGSTFRIFLPIGEK